MKKVFIGFYDHHRIHPVRILWISLGLNLTLSGIFAVAMIFGWDFLKVRPLHHEFHTFVEALTGWRLYLTIGYLFSFLIILFGLVGALIFEIGRRIRLESSLQQAELISLKAQIQPHFLFNALNTIKALIRENPQKADVTVQRLSDLYRYILKASDSELNSVKDELEHSEQYLSIEKIRFGDQLNYNISVDERWLSLTIPSLILQPLVENSIKHGVSKNLGQGMVAIQSVERDGALFLCVSDNGVGFSPKQLKRPFDSNGFGLKNVNERWFLYSGKQIQIDSDESRGTRIYLEFPKHLSFS